MTRQEAIRQAGKRWGKRAAYRVNGDCSSSEQREANGAKIRALRAEKESIIKDTNRRLQGIQWYRESCERQKAIYAELKTLSPMPYYKFQVGSIDGILGAFHIKGEGDTWEQAFADADRRETKAS